MRHTALAMFFAHDLELARTVQRSIEASQVYSSSRKVKGRVQSNTIMTAVCGRADCVCRKCSTKDETVGTDNR